MINGILIAVLAAAVWSAPSTVHRYENITIEELANKLPPAEYWGEPPVPWELHLSRPFFLLQNTGVTLPFLVGGVCHIWIDPDLYETGALSFAVVLFHEWAHCPNGDGSIRWGGNHPGIGTVDVDVEVFFAPWLEAWEANVGRDQPAPGNI